jgi:hypothetical protein
VCVVVFGVVDEKTVGARVRGVVLIATLSAREVVIKIILAGK